MVPASPVIWVPNGPVPQEFGEVMVAVKVTASSSTVVSRGATSDCDWLRLIAVG
jgi:hypothetical protein